MRSMRTLTVCLVVAALALLAVPALLQIRPASATPGKTTLDYFREMDAHYAPLENLPPTQTSGTGFKPYHRYKWFTEPRLDPATGNEIPGCRWNAWLQMRALEQEKGNGSPTWFSDGPINVSGRCLAIAVHPTDPNTVYAGFASGGIWKTTDGGTTWTALDDTLPTLAVGCIKIDPTNPNRIWMGTGEGWGNTDAVHGVGLLESTNAGATWNTTGYSYPLSNALDVYAVDYNPTTGTLILGADNGLWRSTDAGVTFTQLYASSSWTDVQMMEGSSSVWFASSHGGSSAGFFRSTDDGATWTNITNGTPTGIGNNRFALTPANPNLIIWSISTLGGDMMGIWKSTDGGNSFAQVNAGSPNQFGGQGWYDISISVDPTNPNLVLSGGVDFYHSTDGGASFTKFSTNVHVDHHAETYSPSSPNQRWEGSDGGCWKSTDSGATFQDENTGLTTLQFYAINQAETLPTRALGGTQDNGTYLYNNNLNWSYILGGDGFYTEVDRSHPDTLYAELYYGEHYRSTNDGVTMLLKDSGITEQGPWSTPTWMDYSSSAILWTAHNTKIFRSTNYANSWTWMNNPAGLGGGRSISQCRAVTSELVVISGSKVWLTTDSGTTWSDKTSTFFTQNKMSDVACDPVDPNTWVLTCSTYSQTIPRVMKTTDGGNTYNEIDTGLPIEPANTIEIDPQNPTWYFLGTDLGVYVSFDAGTTWAPFNTGLPHVVVDDLRIHDTARILRAGTHGRGLWEVSLAGLGPSAVGQPHTTVQPLTLQVYGNPAKDHALLRYGIRQAGQVRIGLYDLQGRLVRSVVDKFDYPIMTNVDVDVHALPGGVYFLRMDANGAHVSQKVTVEK